MMKRIFDMDNPLMQGLSIVADLLLINVLALLCSLPLITLGPALTAANAVSGKLIRNEGSGTTKDFFLAFRANWKKGGLLGLLLLLAVLLLGFDYLAALAYAPVMRFGIAALGLLALCLFQYAFALLSRYENTLGATLKNAAALAVAYFPRTLGILVFALAFWLLCVRFFRFGSVILLMFGLSLPIYVKCLLLQPVFQKLEEQK